MNHWYAIKTKPHRENDVSCLLQQGGFEVFNPKIRDVFYRRTSSHFKEALLFPSYLFLNIDFSEKTNFHVVKYTRGVSKILCAENKPIAVSDKIIETIKLKANEKGNY